MGDGAWRLSVLTLNLWNINEPLRLRLDRLVEYLRADPPDVVALQEVSRVGERLQSELLADAADYPFVHDVRATRPPLREEGLAVLTRMPSRPWPATRLPGASVGGWRVLQRVSLRGPDSPDRMLIANTHLAYRRRDRARRQAQADTIRTVLHRTLGRAPVVLCGDLNDTPDSSPIATLRGSGAHELIDAWEVAGDGSPGLTFASANGWTSFALGPDRRIDYVLVSRGIRVHACRVVLTGADGWGPVSDHYGVRVELQVTTSRSMPSNHRSSFGGRFQIPSGLAEPPHP